MDDLNRFKRFFTPEEANAMLPSLMDRLERISDKVDNARALAAVAEHATTDAERHDALHRMEAIRVRIEEHLDAIAQSGVEVKGLEPKLLDFPALLNGQIVYLCWREGEDGVCWWHPLHTGIRGRQPIEEHAHGRFEYEN